jgi:hypothetical protein
VNIGPPIDFNPVFLSASGKMRRRLISRKIIEEINKLAPF